MLFVVFSLSVSLCTAHLGYLNSRCEEFLEHKACSVP